VAAGVVRCEPDEGGARLRIKMGRAFAHQVRRPQCAAGTCGRLTRLLGKRCIRVATRFARAEAIAEPAQRKTRGLGNAHHVPDIRQSVAEGVQTCLWIEEWPARRGEDYARGSDGGAHIPRTHDAHADGAGSLVPCPGNDRRSDFEAGERRCLSGDGSNDLLRFIKRRKAGGRQPNGREHLGRPTTLGYVQQQGAGCVRDVDGAFAGELQTHVVLGQEKEAEARPEFGFVSTHPQQLGEGEIGERGVGCELDEPRLANGLGQPRGLRRGTLIAPDECRPQHLVGGIEQHCAVHLAGEADTSDLFWRRGGGVQQFTDGELRRAPPVCRILLRPSGARRGEGNMLVRRRADDPSAAGPLSLHEQCARAPGPDIDAQQLHASLSKFSIDLSTFYRPLRAHGKRQHCRENKAERTDRSNSQIGPTDAGPHVVGVCGHGDYNREHT
jgi:hypothetical protein